MVVLSVAIITKSGKVVLARQFIDMPRGRIEGLISAFNKLALTDATGGSSASGGASASAPATSSSLADGMGGGER
jgi:hypothetical protein